MQPPQPLSLDPEMCRKQAVQPEKGNKNLLTITTNHTTHNSTANNLTELSSSKNISLNLKGWCPEKNKKIKKSGQHIKTELSNNVKVRKSYLADKIPISYTRMTTGSNHGRTLQ